MSSFDPIMHPESKREKVNFIVPERIREACEWRGLSYKKASLLCEIDRIEFGRMANGHIEIPDDMIFKLMKGLGFPKEYFYFVRWERR